MVQKTANNMLERYRALIGEFSWHSLNPLDPTIDSVSKAHYKEVLKVLKKHGDFATFKGLHILEVASYVHTTGYELEASLGAKVTLFDISARSLEFGRKLWGARKGISCPRLVTGDFHDLPFENASFGMVFTCSALHHARNWQKLLSEMVRVLTPGGLLFLENEPCLRASCFYKFQTNRAHEFTPFEKKLDELDVIRTFAQPYPGSRSESLFGMIENQKIPLDSLLDPLEHESTIVQLDVTPEVCMGELEKQWIDNRDKPASELAHMIETSLIEKRRIAIDSMSDVARGLGFTLPSVDEIKSFAERVASLVRGLPDGSAQAFRKELAKLFGASVRVVAKKGLLRSETRGSIFDGLLNKLQKKEKRNDNLGQGRFRRQCPQHHGIYYAFPQDLSELLLSHRSVLPDIQNADARQISLAFPAPCWSFHTDTNGLKCLALCSQSGGILIPAAGNQDLLLILRLYAAADKRGPYAVAVAYDKTELFTSDGWQCESFLFYDIFRVNDTHSQLVINVVRRWLDAQSQHDSVAGTLTVSFAAAFVLSER